MNEDFSKDQATVMLDYLYTMQYQMRGIIAVSLGYANNNAEGYTHASVMRFPSVETLKAYYEHPIRTMITNEYIIPYQHSGEDDKMNEASDKERLLCRNSFAWTMKQMCKMTLCPYFDGERLCVGPINSCNMFSCIVDITVSHLGNVVKFYVLIDTRSLNVELRM
eukprot:c24948_g1_i6 orf=468-962(+)